MPKQPRFFKKRVFLKLTVFVISTARGFETFIQNIFTKFRTAGMFFVALRTSTVYLQTKTFAWRPDYAKFSKLQML